METTFDPTFKPTEKQKAIFLLSWLSNINANKLDIPSGLQTHAEEQIYYAMHDGTLQPMLSTFFPVLNKKANAGNNPIIWGPYSYSQNPTAGYECVTDNLAYITKGVDGTKSLYVVAVSGTNPDSHFGWYNEDFLPTHQVAWPVVNAPSSTTKNPLTDPEKNPATSGGNGSVSAGFATGLDILWNKMNQLDPVNIPLLYTALKKAINEDTSTEIEIAVTGHSLGGALSPMLALAISDAIKAESDLSGKTITVSAWPTAGPTPGNDTYASHLTTEIGKANYKGVYNTNDIVPHGFNSGMMAALNNLYHYKSVFDCYDHPEVAMASQQLTNNLLDYAKTLPANNNYALSTGESTWKGTFSAYLIDLATMKSPITLKPYIKPFDLKLFIDSVMFKGNSLTADMREYLRIIYQGKGPKVDSAPREFVNNLFGYLAQAGLQHTTAYVLSYLSTQEAGALSKYMKIDAFNYFGKVVRITKDLANLMQLLKNAAHYYDPKKVPESVAQ